MPMLFGARNKCGIKCHEAPLFLRVRGENKIAGAPAIVAEIKGDINRAYRAGPKRAVVSIWKRPLDGHAHNSHQASLSISARDIMRMRAHGRNGKNKGYSLRLMAVIVLSSSAAHVASRRGKEMYSRNAARWPSCREAGRGRQYLAVGQWRYRPMSAPLAAICSEA